MRRSSEGKIPTVGEAIRHEPVRFVLYAAIIALVLYLSITPFRAAVMTSRTKMAREPVTVLAYMTETPCLQCARTSNFGSINTGCLWRSADTWSHRRANQTTR